MTTLKLSLDNFKGIPDELDGCACYFSQTDRKFKNKKYLFAAGFESIGFVSVDNKRVKLKFISTGREPNTFGDNDHQFNISRTQNQIRMLTGNP